MESSPNIGELELSLREHQICFVLGVGEQVLGHIRLSRGALIQGYVDGSIECETGSIIIAETGCVIGSISADKVIIEGTVKSVADRQRHHVLGRELVAVASVASVDADLYSKAFSIHSESIQGSLNSLA